MMESLFSSTYSAVVLSYRMLVTIETFLVTAVLYLSVNVGPELSIVFPDTGLIKTTLTGLGKRTAPLFV
jgi:hypothetical protein